jgi:YHS domain-containing protein
LLKLAATVFDATGGPKMSTKDTIGLAVMAAAAVIISAACEQSETKQPTPAAEAEPTSPIDETVAEPAANPPRERPPLPVEAAKAEMKQTLCPVSGAPINRDIFAEYQGQRVYFCCEEHKKMFTRDPEKYTAMLPQFGGNEPAR